MGVWEAEWTGLGDWVWRVRGMLSLGWLLGLACVTSNLQSAGPSGPCPAPPLLPGGLPGPLHASSEHLLPTPSHLHKQASSQPIRSSQGGCHSIDISDLVPEDPVTLPPARSASITASSRSGEEAFGDTHPHTLPVRGLGGAGKGQWPRGGGRVGGAPLWRPWRRGPVALGSWTAAEAAAAPGPWQRTGRSSHSSACRWSWTRR